MRKQHWVTLTLLAGLLAAPTAASATELQNYAVQSGDTLYRIAIENATTIQQLLSLNPDIKNAAKLREGQIVRLPQVLEEDIALNTIQTAEALIGTTQLTDTSFLYFVLKQNGIYIQTLNREELLGQGTAVEKQVLQPGDLVFYKDKQNPASPSHVALYMGNNRIIHVVDNHVRIDGLDQEEESYFTARRVIQ